MFKMLRGYLKAGTPLFPELGSGREKPVGEEATVTSELMSIENGGVWIAAEHLL